MIWGKLLNFSNFSFLISNMGLTPGPTSKGHIEDEEIVHT